MGKVLLLLTSPRRSALWRSRRGGRTGEVRFLDDVDDAPLSIERMIRRLAERYGLLHVCFEAGPTG